jgi:hypothetical protein
MRFLALYTTARLYERAKRERRYSIGVSLWCIFHDNSIRLIFIVVFNPAFMPSFSVFPDGEIAAMTMSLNFTDRNHSQC